MDDREFDQCCRNLTGAPPLRLSSADTRRVCEPVRTGMERMCDRYLCRATLECVVLRVGEGIASSIRPGSGYQAALNNTVELRGRIADVIPFVIREKVTLPLTTALLDRSRWLGVLQMDPEQASETLISRLRRETLEATVNRYGITEGPIRLALDGFAEEHVRDERHSRVCLLLPYWKREIVAHGRKPSEARRYVLARLDRDQTGERYLRRPRITLAKVVEELVREFLQS